MTGGKPCPGVGTVVSDKYEVVKQLGEGGFGAVYEVIDRKRKRSYAMKVELEEPAPDEPGLDTEGVILRRLQGYCHILEFVDEGRHEGRRFMELRRNQPTKAFTNSTVTRLAVQMLEAIEFCHTCSILHRDIKPANFAMGRDSDKRTLFLLDFGLFRNFIVNGKHRPPRRATAFRGSVRYASLNCHNHIDLGRVDDLWSWLYSAIEMRKGKLPWAHETGTKKTGELKAKTTADELLDGMESEYRVIYESMGSLKYESTPPYLAYSDELAKLK